MKVIPSFFKVPFKLIPISFVTILITPTAIVLKTLMRALMTVLLIVPIVLLVMS